MRGYGTYRLWDLLDVKYTGYGTYKIWNIPDTENTRYEHTVHMVVLDGSLNARCSVCYKQSSMISITLK
jgi:hypothetical protein